MLEAATAGAKVLHNRAVSLAKKYRLKLNVRNTRTNNDGTIVDFKNYVNEKSVPQILAIEEGLAKVTIIGENLMSDMSYISKIYSLAKMSNILVYMISISETNIGVVVKEDVAKEFLKLLHENIL